MKVIRYRALWSIGPHWTPCYLSAVRLDQELFDAWRAGDRGAGHELFARHFDAVHKFFANKVDREAEVEEMVQETFLRCVEARDRFQGRSSMRTFLLAVARYVLYESFRGRHRDQALDLETVSLVDMGAGPTTVLVEQSEQRVLLEALRRIPLELQVVLELYYWEQMKGGQIADVLGVPEATARSRIRRAKQLLEQALRRVRASRAVLDSTANDLDGWAAKVRTGLGPAR